MSADKKDQLAIIKVEGMHCHQCERQIRQSLSALPGVHEVEVDFPSSQVSILYSSKNIQVPVLMESIRKAGYKATGIVQNPSSAKSR